MPPKPKAKSSQEKEQDAAASYGWALAVLRSNPELSRLFDLAIKDTWTPGQFVARLRDTKWYKTRSESARQAEVLKKADPAEWQRRRSAMRASVGDMYYQLTGKNAPGKLLWQMSDHAFQFGFNEAEIRNMIGKSFNTANLMRSGLGGTLGEAERQIRGAVEDYGLDLGEPWIATALNRIATQQSDVAGTANYLRQLALRKYGAGFKDELEQGMTIKDIAEPYKQLMAKVLEVSDKSLSVTDPSIQQALLHRESVKGKPGAPVQGGMPLWMFEQKLKADPRWTKTQNAQDSIMSAGRKVLADWGLIGAEG